MIGAVLWILLGWFVAGALGYLVLGCLGVPQTLRRSRYVLKTSESFAGDTAMLAGLSLLTGLGMTAMLIWLRLQSDMLMKIPVMVLDGSFIVMLIAVLGLRRRFFPVIAKGDEQTIRQAVASVEEKSGVLNLVLMLWGWLMVALMTAGVVMNFARRPWGDWDAIMIWTVRARFINRAGTHWADTFTLPAIHPDYPLLIPLSIHRLWQYPMVELPLAPQLVGATFLVSCMLILWGTLRKYRGSAIAWLGLILLIGNPFFVNFGSLQLADVPLAVAFMAAWAMVLLASHEYAANRSSMRWWVVAGVMFGLTLWIKNEGMMMLLASGAGLIVGWSVLLKQDAHARRIVQLKTLARRMILPVFTGFFPFLLVWLWAKMTLVASNDLLRAQSQNAQMEKLTDVSRHTEILRAYEHMIAFNKPVWCSVMLVLLILLAGWHVSALGSAGRMLYGMAIAIIVCMLGYYTVYLLSPYDLAWHLETSLSRLMTQFWPAFVLWAMMVVNLSWLRTKP